ncbi:hypothetical protein HY792_01740 [Candidatus Desantisbacteria bacterium]|nr:hypothetical protein [Candidatus Desantisbacteria bacterium]
MEEKSVAFNLAEAGIEKAIWHLKKGNIDYKGEDSLLGNGRFRVKVDEKDDRIFITSTGYIPNQKEIRVKVIIRKEDLKVVLWE